MTAARQLMSELDKDSLAYEGGAAAIISTSIRDGEYETAFEALATLSSSDQLELLHYISAVAIKTGRNEQARTGLDLALKLLVKDPEDCCDTRSLGQFATKAIDLGDVKLAAQFIDAIKDDSPRKAQALISLAQHQLKQGEKAAAIVTVDSVLEQLKLAQADDAYEFAALVPHVAKLLVAVDGREKAFELLKVADQNEIPEGDRNQERYQSLRAAAFANLGEFEQALSITESQEGEAKSEGLIALALAYGERGNAQAALSSMRYARDVTHTSKIDNMHGRIVSAYLKLGHPDEALAVLRETHHRAFPLVEAAIEVAHAYQKADRRQAAIDVLDVALSETRKMISEKSAEIPAIASFSIARGKSMGLAQLARAYLDLGYLPGAENAAGAIDQPQFKASLWSQLAMAYHKNSESAKAKSFLNKAFSLSARAESYNHDFRRIDVLVGIAEAYAEIGAKQEAGKVILRSLTVLRDEGEEHTTIDALINIGRACEKNGIPTSKSAQTLLANIVKRYRDDN